MSMGSLPYGKTLVPRPLALLSGLFLIAGAAGAGWFLARQVADQPVVAAPVETVTVTTGTAQLKLRDGWQVQAKVPRVPGFESTNAKALAPADGGTGRMVVSLVKIDETGDLPAATMDALRVPLPKPERATVGGLRGTGYTALSLRGVTGLVDVYTFRTVAGLLTVSCVAPIDDPLPTGSCPADISAISVSVPQAPDPAAQLKAALPRLTTDLDRVRTTSRLALRSGADSAAQASAAKAIDSAYGSAADEIAAVAPKDGVGAKLADVFRSASAAYGTLASAATAHDEKAWTSAEHTVNEAELEVATALAAVGS